MTPATQVAMVPEAVTMVLGYQEVEVQVPWIAIIGPGLAHKHRRARIAVTIVVALLEDGVTCKRLMPLTSAIPDLDIALWVAHMGGDIQMPVSRF